MNNRFRRFSYGLYPEVRKFANDSRFGGIDEKFVYQLLLNFLYLGKVDVFRVLKKGEKVTISGFGTFKVTKVKDKKGRRSPTDPTPIVHKAHRVVRFVVSKTLKRVVK